MWRCVFSIVDVRFVRVGGGGALHVSCILFEISWTRCSNALHDACHWLGLR